MITDPQRAKKTYPGDPAVCNVFSFHEIYSSDETIESIRNACPSAQIGCVECKKMMASALKEGLEPIRTKRRELEADIDRVKEIMEEGNKKSRTIARQTMEQVREAVKI